MAKRFLGDYLLVDGIRERGARKRLVDELKSTKNIKDEAVLRAIAKVPRHYFFPVTFWNQAYQNIAFKIGAGQTISHPYTVAYQTELLQVQKNDKILEIGTGSGYQTCILLELGAEVFTIERQELLYQRTRLMLPKMGYHPQFFLGDGSLGIPQHAPFDKIIVTAGAPFLPQILLQQLAIGGIAVVPVGDAQSQKMMTILRVSETDYEQYAMETFKFVPLVGDQAW